MSALAFDTLKASKAMKAAGFDDAQVEAVIATVGDAVGGNVATKADMQALRTDVQAFKADMQADMQALRTDMKAFKADMQADMQALRTDMQVFKADMQADMQAFKAEACRRTCRRSGLTCRRLSSA